MASIIVIGGGFAGYSALKSFYEKGLTRSHDVFLIDPSPQFVYLPSLPYLLSNKKRVEEITEPFKNIARRLGFEHVKEAAVRVESTRRQVILESGDKIKYDYLLVAAGAKPEYFNIPGVEDTYAAWRLKHYLVLKSVLKNAANVVVIGGGLTGVEVAGEAAEVVGPRNVTIVEKMDRLVPFLNNPYASLKAREFLEKKGIKIITGSGVTKVVDGKVVILDNGEKVEADTIVWTVGIRAVNIGFDKEPERVGRGWLKVTPEMRIPGFENIYAAGDIVALKTNTSYSCKMAEEAILQGRVAALNITYRVLGKDKRIRHSPIFTTDKPKTLLSLGFNRGLLVWNRIVHLGRFPYTAKMIIEHVFMSDVKGRPLGGNMSKLEMVTIKTLNKLLG